jgi:5-methylcytosine-specific restriction endonuclease McrA
MASGWIGKGTRRDIYRRDAHICCYCGKTCMPATIKGMSRAEQSQHMRDHYADIITLDHIVPQWEIAQTCESDAEFRRKVKDPANLVSVCNGCNSSKKHTPLYIWAVNKGFDYAVILERIAERIQNHV